MDHAFETRSHLPGVTPQEVWRAVTSWRGVNHELGPLLRMTHPARYPGVEDIPTDGRCHFVSVVLLLGVIPVELHRVAFRGLEAGDHFDEVSSNLTMREWHHYRSVRAVEGGVEVVDRCRIVPRAAWLGPLLERIYRAVFRRRHRRLRARFAEAAVGG